MWSRKCRPTLAALAAGVVLSSCMLVPAALASEVSAVGAGPVAIEQVVDASEAWVDPAATSEPTTSEDVLPAFEGAPDAVEADANAGPVEANPEALAPETALPGTLEQAASDADDPASSADGGTSEDASSPSTGIGFPGDTLNSGGEISGGVPGSDPADRDGIPGMRPARVLRVARAIPALWPASTPRHLTVRPIRTRRPARVPRFLMR